MVSLLIATAYAGSINADKITVGALRGQNPGDGITISSHAYLVPGSSLTLQGSEGFITTASSISASSFWGDGKNLSDVAILNATQTASGSNIFTSSLTIRSSGKEVVLSTDSTTANIRVDTDGRTTFSPFLHLSSATTVPNFTTTTSSLSVCVPGSTITLVTSGGRVEVSFSGQIQGGSPGSVSFLQDGSFVGNLSQRAGLSATSIRATGLLGFTYLTDVLSPGAHSYCLLLADIFGSGVRLIGSPATDVNGRNIFYVKEIK